MLVLRQVQNLTHNLINKQNEKYIRLKQFVQTQESEESNTFLINNEVLSKEKRLHEEVCKYISQFDDGNDKAITDACSSKRNNEKQMNITERH